MRRAAGWSPKWFVPFVSAAAWTLVVVSGCTPTTTLVVEEARASYALIAPRYELYLRSDPALSIEEREQEIGLSRSLTRLLEEAAGREARR